MTNFSKILCTSLIVSAAVAVTGCNQSASQKVEAASGATFGIYLVDNAAESAAAMEQAKENGRTPPGTAYFPSQNGDGYIVTDGTKLTQSCLSSATGGEHPETGRPIINFKFDENCTQLFAAFTSENIGRKFAVVLNDDVVAAPIIRSPITRGYGFIEGNFTAAQAKDISAGLNRVSRNN